MARSELDVLGKRMSKADKRIAAYLPATAISAADMNWLHAHTLINKGFP